MRKVVIMVLAFCCFAFSQGKQKVAVYMLTPEPKDSKVSYNMLISKFVESISQSSTVFAVNHTADIINELKKDNRSDRALDENQIKFMGRVFKAPYFCMLEVTPRKSSPKDKNYTYEFNVRMIDVATGSVISSASAETTKEMRDINENIMRVGRQAVREIEVANMAQAGVQTASKSIDYDKKQEKPRIAVYVAAGDMDDSEKRAAQTIILDGLVKSGVYRTIERTDAFLEELTKEQQKQRSGSVDEKQIVALGRQAGAQYICIVDVAWAFGSSQLSARIVDVLTAEVLSSGVSSIPVNKLNDLTRASEEVIEKMLGKRPRVR
ncbi:MAG: CsgG/HfaB family protein [Chitinispirillales bacterium]|jgi:curli biogenesis system outer membrane secretion channel CsgG|nr:CsgG/HfaB family protein [Chitinispirillales bacterium]